MADDLGEDGDDNGDASTPPLNSQIVHAVRQSTAFVFDPAASIPPSSGTPASSNAGTAIAYQKVAQAAALAVQDGTDYQRNIMSISTVAQGQALALMFSTKQTNPYLEILLLAMLAPIAAAVTVGIVNTVATEVATTFPKS